MASLIELPAFGPIYEQAQQAMAKIGLVSGPISYEDFLHRLLDYCPGEFSVSADPAPLTERLLIKVQYSLPEGGLLESSALFGPRLRTGSILDEKFTLYWHLKIDPSPTEDGYGSVVAFPELSCEMKLLSSTDRWGDGWSLGDLAGYRQQRLPVVVAPFVDWSRLRRLDGGWMFLQDGRPRCIDLDMAIKTMEKVTQWLRDDKARQQASHPRLGQPPPLRPGEEIEMDN